MNDANNGRRPWPEARRRRTRAKLLAAAYRLMSRTGVDATSLQQITEAAGLGAGTFYNYFASKEDVAAQVLDCLIHDLKRQVTLAIEASGGENPVEALAIAIRYGLRRLLSDRIWHWWIRQPDLLVERTRSGFRDFGIGQLRAAQAAGGIAIPGGDIAAAWSMAMWQMTAAAKDTMDGHRKPDALDAAAVSILQALGVAPTEAARLCATTIPEFASRPIDFTFVASADDESTGTAAPP